MKKYFYLFIILFSLNAIAQKEANIWYFGQNAGLDFNSGAPVAISDGQLDTYEGCATISDTNGNLLFYTDGSIVYNRNHVVMQNGAGLNGHNSSTSSAIVVPKPNTTNIYYIFTVDWQGESNGLQYSEIDMTLDAGLGGITTNKNIPIETPVSEKLSAVKHANGTDYWVMSHRLDSNEYIAYLVTGSGVNITPVVSAIGAHIQNDGWAMGGYMKFSPNGKKLAAGNGQFHQEVQLFDFDNGTGFLSNTMTFPFPNAWDIMIPYGIEFSPNSQLLYVAAFDDVSQFDISSNNESIILSTKTQLATYILGHRYSALQLGPDGKIYCAPQVTSILDVIDKPNNVGLSCDYTLNALPITGTVNAGLPTFIQSYFNIGIGFEYNCLGDNTSFKLNRTVDSVDWDFGDAASGGANNSTAFKPTHTFTTSGTYTVTATAISGADTAVTTIEVVISEVPVANVLTNIQTCDLDITNDGVTTIDLTIQNNDLLGVQDPTQFAISYHTTLVDATDGTDAIITPNSFQNTTSPYIQTIFARIQNNTNNTCYDTTSFDVEVFDTPYPSSSVSPIITCDNTSFGTEYDGLVEFDLTQRAIEILNGQSSSDFDLNYFEDAGFTIAIPTPTTFVNSVVDGQTIYVEMINVNNASCIATTSFEIEVLGMPTITPIVELKQCDDDLDGFSAFNLEEVKEKISTNYVNETITFYETLNDAENGFPVITNTINYINQTISVDTIWARIENSNGCYKTAEVNLIVSATQIPINFQRDFYKCDDDTDGIVSFDFSSAEVDVLALLPAGQLPVITYYQSLSDALAETNAILDISNYENSSSPNYQDIYVRVDSDLDNSCLGLGAHISLTVETVPVANLVTIADECDPDGDGLFEFDTSTIESTLVGLQTNVTVFYFDELGSPLPSPLPNPFQTGTQTITARVENALSQDPNGACFDETTISFSVDAAAVANPIDDQIECDDDIDNQFPFDTSTIEATVLGSQTGMIVSYTDSNGTMLPSPLPNPFLTGNETIIVRVENPLNTICFEETTFDFIVNERPQFELDDEDVICINESPTLNITTYNPNNVYSYSWSGPNGFSDTGASTTVSEGGVYTVVATSIEGCESFPHDIIINESELATITHNMVTIVDDSDNNTISIDASQLGFGDYEYALDNEFGIYQDDPYFENVPAGIHMIYVRDKNNCGTKHLEVSVIGYPKFFTPNNDGENDTWQILGVNSAFYPNSIIHIYDRFGKIVANISPTSDGWDGYYNGTSLPSTDYWFSVQLIAEDGTVTNRQGNFSLIRR